MGVRIHRARTLETTMQDGIPVTTPARTIVDLPATNTHVPGTTLTRSELEERFLQLCRAHGLPRPRVNHPVEGKERDFVFVAERVVIEADSWRHHRSRAAFEADRHRDAVLLRAGYRTLRVTDRQLTNDPHDVAATLHAPRPHDTSCE
jgi:very-short-patch-repair endonuclease